jgi:hypothetical protein
MHDIKRHAAAWSLAQHGGQNLIRGPVTGIAIQPVLAASRTNPGR